MATNRAKLAANSSATCKLSCQLYPQGETNPRNGCCDDVWVSTQQVDAPVRKLTEQGMGWLQLGTSSGQHVHAQVCGTHHHNITLLPAPTATRVLWQSLCLSNLAAALCVISKPEAAQSGEGCNSTSPCRRAALWPSSGCTAKDGLLDCGARAWIAATRST